MPLPSLRLNKWDQTSVGKLRAIGYDAKARILRMKLDDGSALEYSGIDEVQSASA